MRVMADSEFVKRAEEIRARLDRLRRSFGPGHSSDDYNQVVGGGAGTAPASATQRFPLSPAAMSGPVLNPVRQESDELFRTFLADTEWFKQEVLASGSSKEKYRGQYVAVFNKEIVAIAPELGSLLDTLHKEYGERGSYVISRSVIERVK